MLESNYSLIISTILSFLIITGGLSWFIRNKNQLLGADLILLLFLSFITWSTLSLAQHAFQYFDVDINTSFFETGVLYAVCLIPPLILGVSLAFATKNYSLNFPALFLLFTTTLFTSYLLFSLDSHYMINFHSNDLDATEITNDSLNSIYFSQAIFVQILLLIASALIISRTDINHSLNLLLGSFLILGSIPQLNILVAYNHPLLFLLTPLTTASTCFLLLCLVASDRRNTFHSISVEDIFNNMSDPVIVTDQRGRVNALNHKAAMMLNVQKHSDFIDAVIFDHLPKRQIKNLMTEDDVTEEILIEKEEITAFQARNIQIVSNSDSPLNILTFHDVTKRREDELALIELKEELQLLANTDSLTGLDNRRQFIDRLHQEAERSSRYRLTMSILLMDLDYFKAINDKYGHDVGDRVLITVSGVIQLVKRTSDTAARIGGEEFAIILPETDKTGAMYLAERLRKKIASQIIHATTGEYFNVTSSIGVTSLHAGKYSPEFLMKQADLALYEAKKNGRNRVKYVSLNSPEDLKKTG